MHLIKSLVIAFSIYSNIPVPQFEWKDEDMKYMFCFFPWIGVVTGVCVYLWNVFCRTYDIGELCRCAISAAIPIFVTGGIHMDGFIDTMDAFCSHQPKERKLEILKDAHIGAFAVIMLAAYILVWVGAFSAITDEDALKIVCCGFFLSRCLCGISAISFPAAKSEGMLYMFTHNACIKNAGKKAVLAALYIQCIACVAAMLFISFYKALFVIAAAVISLVYYYRRCAKELGGVTGDTSGYFVMICEVCVIAAGAVGK